MIRVGVLADTHFRDGKKGASFLQELFCSHFQEIDMIFHAGDVGSPDSLLAFTEKPVYVVRGNMDAFTPGVPERKIISAGGFRFGLIHGWGASQGLEKRVLDEFRGENLDCLVYGHSHMPACRWAGGVLMFNPGSPTDRRWSPFHSVGILEVGNRIRGRIIRLDGTGNEGHHATFARLNTKLPMELSVQSILAGKICKGGKKG